MTPLERKAAFKSAVTLREMSMGDGARELGVSYNHLMLVIDGERVGSQRLREAFAQFIGRAEREVFGPTWAGRARNAAGESHGSRDVES